MIRFSVPTLSSVMRNTFAATVLTLAASSAAVAQDYSLGLQAFLAQPTDFVAISEGAPGPVTHASMVGDTLLVQFQIPTHAGETFGEVVGKIDANGAFTGNGILIGEGGHGRAAAVSMTFQDDGTIIANVAGGQQDSGFVSKAAYYGS